MSEMKKLSVITALALAVILLYSGCKVMKRQNIDAHSGATKVQHDNMLLSVMKDNVAKGIMIGHQDDLAYGIGWKFPNGKSDVYKVLGDYPAVFGWDLGGIENASAYNLDSVPFEYMKRFAIFVDSIGGINTFSWHLDNPVTGEDSWETGDKTVVKNILPGGNYHNVYKQWLDKVAAFLADLKDIDGNSINVIFRPFHEHTGSWFWWGDKWCTPDEYKQLWQFTHNYLTKEKHLKNLVFAYSTAGDFNGEEEYLTKYPGDAYVDIVGFDMYQNEKESNTDFSNQLKNQLAVLKSIAEKHSKISALTEIGYEQIPYKTWWTEVFLPSVQGSGISYALFWRNAANRPNHYYLPYPGQKSETDFKKLASEPNVLFLKKLTQK